MCAPGTGRPVSSRSHNQWCEQHWAPVRAGVLAGTMSGLQATVTLVEEYLALLEARGFNPDPHQPRRLNRLILEHSPLCCYVGEAARARVLEAARASPQPPEEAAAVAKNRGKLMH